MKIPQHRGEAWVAGALALLGAYMVFEGLQMPSGMGNQPGAGMVPTGIGIVLSLCGVSLLLRLRGAGKTAPETVEIGNPRIAVTLVALIAAAFLLEPLGYLPTSALLLGTLMRSYGQPSWRVTLLASIGGALLTWWFFGKLLGVTLPSGLLGGA